MFWDDYLFLGTEKLLEFRHAYPSPVGSWWLWSNQMNVQEPYKSTMAHPQGQPPIVDPEGTADGFMNLEQLLSLSTNGQSAFFVVSDGQVTTNYVFMAINDTYTLEESWDLGELRVLSSYELDFDAMKPNAFWLMAQLITFQNPDFGLPDVLGQLVSYAIGLAFWFIIALLLYTVVTKLIPTIQGGIEN